VRDCVAAGDTGGVEEGDGDLLGVGDGDRAIEAETEADGGGRQL
jgi:hypothetical protein